MWAYCEKVAQWWQPHGETISHKLRGQWHTSFGKHLHVLHYTFTFLLGVDKNVISHAIHGITAPCPPTPTVSITSPSSHLSTYHQFIFSYYDGKHKFSKIRSARWSDDQQCTTRLYYVFKKLLCEIALHYRQSNVVLESRLHKKENPNPLMIHLLLLPLIALLYTRQQELFPECCQTYKSDISKYSVITIKVNCRIVQWFVLKGTSNII